MRHSHRKVFGISYVKKRYLGTRLEASEWIRSGSVRVSALLALDSLIPVQDLTCRELPVKELGHDGG